MRAKYLFGNHSASSSGLWPDKESNESDTATSSSPVQFSKGRRYLLIAPLGSEAIYQYKPPMFVSYGSVTL